MQAAHGEAWLAAGCTASTSRQLAAHLHAGPGAWLRGLGKEGLCVLQLLLHAVPLLLPDVERDGGTGLLPQRALLQGLGLGLRRPKRLRHVEAEAS
jgi:hypothetical protein